MKEKYVVLGSGPLGLAVMRSLSRRGLSTRVVNRSGKIPEGAPTGVEFVAGDINESDFIRQVTEDAKVVFQCAQPAYHTWVEAFPPLQEKIIQAAHDNGFLLVVGENLYMYGEVNGLIHEGLPYNASTRKGKVRATMSTQLLQAHQEGKIKAVIGRGSDFYGPYVLGSTFGERTIRPLIQGKTVELVGSSQVPHTYTYISDFGEALVILSENESAWGEAWHVPNPPTLTQGELLDLFSKELNLKPKVRIMGKGMMRLGGLFIPEARESIEMMYEFEKPFVVDHQKFINRFGNIATDQEICVRETINWYRKKFSL